MKKLVIVLAVAVCFVAIVYATMKNLNYNNRVELAGASHRVVVLVVPANFSVGTSTVIINETFTLEGTKSKINGSVNVQVE